MWATIRRDTVHGPRPRTLLIPVMPGAAQPSEAEGGVKVALASAVSFLTLSLPRLECREFIWRKIDVFCVLS